MAWISGAKFIDLCLYTTHDCKIVPVELDIDEVQKKLEILEMLYFETFLPSLTGNTQPLVGQQGQAPQFGQPFQPDQADELAQPGQSQDAQQQDQQSGETDLHF